VPWLYDLYGPVQSATAPKLPRKSCQKITAQSCPLQNNLNSAKTPRNSCQPADKTTLDFCALSFVVRPTISVVRPPPVAAVQTAINAVFYLGMCAYPSPRDACQLPLLVTLSLQARNFSLGQCDPSHSLQALLKMCTPLSLMSCLYLISKCNSSNPWSPLSDSSLSLEINGHDLIIR
jgi:hypothetical protein